METTKEILNRYGETMVLLLRGLIAPYSATGKTVRSIRYRVVGDNDTESLLIFARPFLKTLETGRGPRKSTQPSGLEDKMLEYMRARGIDKGSEKKNKQFARFLAYRMNKEGDNTFKSGGREIFSGQLKIVTDSMKMVIIAQKSKEYLTSLKSIFE